MTFEDLFSTDLNSRIAVYWDCTSKPIFCGCFTDFPEEVKDKIRTRRVSGMTESEDGVQVVKIDETFADLLDNYPELFDFETEIYFGKVLAGFGVLSKMPPELLLNMKPRSVLKFEFTDDLKKAIITLQDYSGFSQAHEYPLLKDDLPKLRKHHLGWTVIIITQDDDEYDRFTLTEQLTEYETDPRFQDVLSEQIDTEDNWDDVAEIYIATNICAPFEE